MDTENRTGIEVQILRSARKTLAIEIQRSGAVVVRAPYRLPEKEIWRFLREKEMWIRKYLKQAEESCKTEEDDRKLSREELRELAEAASQTIPSKVKRFAGILGVTYGGITIRCQKTRWGSCSSRGNLNFNCLLMLAPEEVLDYVVVHEVCHRLEMNHSPRFWALVEQLMPDYRTRRKWLKDYGSSIMNKRG